MNAAPILALVTDAFGGRGGIAQYNRDLLQALAGTGDVAVLPRHAPDHHGPLPAGVLQHVPQSGRMSYAIAALCLLMMVRPRIVFCGHLFMAPLAALLARLSGAKLIVQLHGIEAWERPSRLQRTAVEGADLVLCVSRDTRAKVLSWAALASERAVVLPNTVGDAFIIPGDRAAARAHFGLGDQTVLLSVSRLDPRERYKGHDRVIEALPSLVAAGRDLVYVIAGEGADRARLEQLAQDLGVAKHVSFVGSVPTNALPDLYGAVDLFVLPSNGEGFGIVFLEAMASGTPALGLATAGAKDALADGDLGYVTSIRGFLSTLVEALDDTRPEPEKLAKAVRERFGRDLFAARAQAVIERFTT